MIKDPVEVGEGIITARGDTEVIANSISISQHEADNIHITDEDDYDRRPQRRRYEEPLSVRVRKQLLSVAESPLKRVEDEITIIGKTVCDNYEDLELRSSFFDLVLQLVVEQPFKIPFVAAVVLLVNTLRSEMVDELLTRAAARTNAKIREGEWREVKLLMKFLGGLQGLLEGEGVWAVLQDIFTKAVDLQTENNEEVSPSRHWSVTGAETI
jgi:nuclear cap-binding protein subunit 1